MDQNLIEALSRGDREKWREFLSVQIPKLYAMFLKTWPNPALAEELVQKTVLDAIKGFRSYDSSKGLPEEWFFGIARNNIRLEIRRRSNSSAFNGDISVYLDAIDTDPLPPEILEKQETAQLVRQAMDKLPDNERDVLKYKYVEDLPAEKIGLRMNLTEKAVYSLLYRAKISLRSRLTGLSSSQK